MNRRSLIASALVAAIPISAQAQGKPESQDVLIRYLEMLSTRNWAIADEIIAEDYATIYSYPNVIPGREAFKQRRASDTLYTTFETINYTLVTSAQTGEFLFFLSEMNLTMFGGKELMVPYFGYLVIRDGQIAALDAFYDQQRMVELMSA